MPTTAPTDQLSRQLARMYEPIGDDLLQAEHVLRTELRSRYDFIAELTSRVQLYAGKRLRPALLLLVAKATGPVRPEHHTLAAVVEMIHAATLVHDDVLDDADTRRHVTTVNAEWGTEASVLLGDYLFTHAFHLAASTGSADACRRIGQATNRVCEGELRQISRRGYFELTEKEYLEIVQGKTAELIACGCRLGAGYAGASEEVVTAMEVYGRQLGIAFQIIDDLIDLLSSEAQAGKSLGSDLEKQKVTLPVIRLRETASASLLRQLRGIFDQPQREQRGELVELLRQTDAIEYARSRAAEFAGEAAHQLRLLPDSPARQVMQSLTQFVLQRSA